MSEEKIKIKAMCVFEKGGKLLATKGFDKIDNQYFYRLLGGGVEFQEMSEDAIKREIKEELGCEIENLKFLEIIENAFVYNGEKGHEIVFIYKGDLSDKSLYEKEKIPILDLIDFPEKFPAEWISAKDVLEKKIILYPEMEYGKIL